MAKRNEMLLKIAKYEKQRRHNRMVELFPMTFECLDGNLYFIDKGITELPLEGKRTMMAGRKFCHQYNWGVVKNLEEMRFNNYLNTFVTTTDPIDASYIMLLEDQSYPGSILKLSSKCTISHESCVGLYEHLDIEIIHDVEGSDPIVYDKESIMRVRRIKNIIESDEEQ